MGSKRYALVILVLALLCREAPASQDCAWLLAYAGKSTNQLIWDKRIGSLIHDALPASLADRVAGALGGPPDPVFVTDRRYVSMSACFPHACGEKAFLWVDTQTGNALGAHADCSYPENGAAWRCAVRLGSTGLSRDTIPVQAAQALRAWMTEQGLALESIGFIGRDGTVQELDAAVYAPAEKFHPPAGGPSFDCARASSQIEADICGDPAVARLDLDLATLYEQIRHGVATEPAQQALRDLQRQWLQHRNSRCSAVADRAACLTEEYQRQRETLGNWVPARAAAR
jgi:uncharacterized protein YecT (DUF1311 family)